MSLQLHHLPFLVGAMNVMGSAASPSKVSTAEQNRPATAEPKSRDNLFPNGAPVRKATSQEALSATNESSKANGSSSSTPKSARRSSLAGRFLSAITD